MKTEINNINNEIVKISVKNNKRLNIILCNLGASIRNIFIDDKKISLSPKDDSLFIRNDNYFGKTIGRTAGRIKNGEYILNGKNANLEKNDGNNNLHSGKDGYHQKLFDYEIINDNDYTRVVFKYYSPNLDGGHLGE